MSFGGPPVSTETVEEADELLRHYEKESAIGAFLLPMVYFTVKKACLSKFC